MELFFEINSLDNTPDQKQILQNILHQTDGIYWIEKENKFLYKKELGRYTLQELESELFRIFSGIISNYKIEGKFKFDLYYTDHSGDLKFARTKTLESEII